MRADMARPRPDPHCPAALLPCCPAVPKGHAATRTTKRRVRATTADRLSRPARRAAYLLSFYVAATRTFLGGSDGDTPLLQGHVPRGAGAGRAGRRPWATFKAGARGNQMAQLSKDKVDSGAAKRCRVQQQRRWRPENDVSPSPQCRRCVVVGGATCGYGVVARTATPCRATLR